MSNEVYKSFQSDDRALRTLSGHTDWIWTMAYLPDGQRLVTGSADKTIRIWRIRDGKQEGQSMVHAADVRDFVVTNDGRRIISADVEGNFTVWDVATQGVVEAWKHREPLSKIAISTDGRLAYGKKTIIIRDVNSRRINHKIEIGAISSLCFSRDGSKLAIGRDDTIFIVDVESGRPILTLKGHGEGWVSSLRWSRDGSRLYSASSDRMIRYWNTDTGEQIGRPWTGHTDIVWSLSLSRDGTKLVSGSNDRSLRFWDASGHPIGRPLQQQYSVLVVRTSPWKDVITAAGMDRKVTLLRVPWWSGTENKSTKPTPLPIPSVSSGIIAITAYPTTRTLQRGNSHNPENAPGTCADSLQVTARLPPHKVAFITTPSAYNPQPRDTQSQVVGDPPSARITDLPHASQTINDEHLDQPREPSASEGVESRTELNIALSRTGRPSDAHDFPFPVPSTTPQIAPPQAGSTFPHAPTSQEDSNNHSLTAPLDLTRFIVKLEDQYSEGGAFGDVYRCQYNSPTGATEVAVKSFRFRFTLDEGGDASHSSKMVRRELGIWRRLDHPNIVPFLGIAHGFGMKGSLSLVSAWMPNGSLHGFLEKHGGQLHVAHQLQLDIANGLDHLHSFHVSPIIHGDLNTNNVLMDRNFTPCLVDFGYSTVVGSIPEGWTYLQRSTSQPGAFRWAAPELILAEEAPERTPKSDIYSFGCLGLQVLSGKQPWWEVWGEAAITARLLKGEKPNRPSSRKMDDRHWEFVEGCWSSPKERPTAVELASVLQDFLTSCQQSSMSLRDMFSSPSS